MQEMRVETIQHTALAFIEDVPAVTEDEQALLSQIGDLLRAHGKTEQLGMCLLHKHFDLGPGEILLEETDADARISVTRVQPAGDLTEPTVTTMWRFSRDALAPGTQCVVQCIYAGSHGRRHVKRGV